ncbi:MAG: heavy metal-binding domain-containing protein [Vampirovibrio sp.]|nr:heavy metal-binding domain-containing protein [Vampirovibrio sp.]
MMTISPEKSIAFVENMIYENRFGAVRRAKQVALSVGPGFSNQTINDQLGMVFGEGSFSPSLKTDFDQFVRNLAGAGKLGTQTVLRNSRQEAMTQLQLAAKKKGADGVANVRLMTVPGAQHFTGVVAYGDAVTFEKDGKGSGVGNGKDAESDMSESEGLTGASVDKSVDVDEIKPSS